MPNPMEINFQPIPSWALVSANPQTGNTNLIPPMEPIKLNIILQWGQTLMTQLQHMAVEIRNLQLQIQGDKTKAYRIFMGMQKDYHKIELNLNNVIVMVQQYATEAMEAHFNPTTDQFTEVAAAHIALQRHIETIAIGNTANKEQ
jgi:acetylglutamate synthase